MIVRLWRAQIDPARRSEFQHLEEEHLAPLLEKQPGFGGVLFLRQDEELTVLTLWDSRQSADEFNGSQAVLELTDQVRSRGFLLSEPRIEVFDITAGSFR